MRCLLLLLLLGCGPEMLVEIQPNTPDEAAMPLTMPGFSWVTPNRLAAMPRPRADDHAFLDAQQIGFVVSLTEDRPRWLVEADVPGLHLPVEDFQPPTLVQQITFVDAVQAQVEQGTRVAVHCTAGLGRSGTLVATWFVAQGLDAESAISLIRQLRPGSIETQAQAAQVHVYETHRND